MKNQRSHLSSIGKNNVENKSKKLVGGGSIILLILILIIFTVYIFINQNDAKENNQKSENEIVDTQSKAKWYEKNKLVMHALGGVDGKTYLNAKEGLEYYYKKGQRVFEVDLTLAADGKTVAIHDWGEELTEEYQQYTFSPDNVPTSDTFVSRKIFYKYTALKFEDLLQFMLENDDVYFITDIKALYDTHQIDTIKDIVKSAKEVDESLLQRIIVQVYNEKNFEEVNNVYPFKNYIFTLYTYPDADFDQIASFCLKNNIDVVTMGKGNIDDHRSIDAFIDNNIKIYIHTENSLYKMKWYFGQNVDGIYTDFITDKDLELIDIK